MKLHAIYLVIVNGVVLSAHNSEELAKHALDRLFSIGDLDISSHSIEVCPLSLKGKREIVSVGTFFGINNADS